MAQIIPQEIWYTVCEYLPLISLQKFKLNNKTLYYCLKQRFPNIVYNENINYVTNILPQLINLTTKFVTFSLIDLCLYNPEIINESIAINYAIVIVNNCDKEKTLFNISNLTQNICNFNNRADDTPKYFTTYHLHSNFLHLITENNELRAIDSKNLYYNNEQYYSQTSCSQNKCNNMYKLYFSALDKIPKYKKYIFINGVKINYPWYYTYNGDITDCNFELENSDVEQIYKNVFVVKDSKIMSYFSKGGIKFYIMCQKI